MRRFLLILLLLFCVSSHLSAGDPHSAYYSPDTDKLLWFIHASDLHIGTLGSTDSVNLQWLTGQARTVIDPSFIVVTGDLTDSTNGNILGYPNGPYQAEWDQYKSILGNNGVDANVYFDIPGNHDAYNDRNFNYYLANSIQGRATGRTQASWSRTGPWGKHHFLGINSADNTGNPFSLTWPYGDYAGLDASELSFIGEELYANPDASLTLVFGHHPLASTGSSTDTYLFYGKDEFVSLMDGYGSSLYGYGHTHGSSETFYTQNMTDGVFYFNVSALGKDSPNPFTVMAIDCNGIASVTQTVGTWPVVLITAPMDRRLGGSVNPYAYPVTNGTSNPIRALVFDPAAVAQVQFRVNGGAWQAMQSVSGNPRLWQGVWDASTLAEGEYAVDVQATTVSGVRTDTVATYVKSLPDSDGDGLPDVADNCPDVANVDQADIDSDGIGNACDTGDYDGDGLPDYLDTQPDVYQTPLDDDTAFVRQVYLDFLNREPDAEGLLYWVGQLTAGSLTRAALVEQYLLSPEFGETVAPVVRLYFTYFLRLPDYDGLMFWVNSHAAGVTLNQISEEFAQSPEFIDRYGTLSNEEFVRQMYLNVYEREPDAEGLAFWTGHLDAGNLTRGAVMVYFSTAGEYLVKSANQVYVTMTYIGLLRREPDQGGFDFWVEGMMNQGVSGQELLNLFLESAEYAARF